MIKQLKNKHPDEIPADDYLGLGDEAENPKATSCGGVLARLLLDEVLSPEVRARIRTERGIAVLVEAPSAAWVSYLRGALADLAAWGHIEVRDGSSRYKRKPEDGAALADAVGAGLRVAVVCHAPEAHVPPAFIATADMRLRLGRPTVSLVEAAIKTVTGEAPRDVPAQVDRLDLSDLLVALRSGAGGAAACVRRLERAVTSGVKSSTPLRDVPPIHDLHGMGPAGDWCRRLVEDFRTMPADAFWREADRCCVISGPPGVGKTSLMHSLALTMKLDLLETSISSWFEGSSYLDRTLAALVAAFSGARSQGRSSRGVILACDELDAMPSREDGGDERHTSYWKPLQQAYLREVEATAAAGVRVILIGATNYAGRLDPAILRPGRFGRVVHVPKPDAIALAAILRQHLGPELPDADLSGVADAGLGSTGADVTAWVKAARRAARIAGRPVMLADLAAEVLPAEDRSEADLWRCAVHEAAHAVVAHAEGSGRVQRVSIVSIGKRGGATMVSSGGAPTLGKDGLQALVVAALAGRAGEAEFGLGASTGSHDDLAQATRIAASIRVSFGFGGTLVHRADMDRAACLLEQDRTLRTAVGRDLDRGYAAALASVRANRDLIGALATLLMERRVVDGADFLRLVEAQGMAPAPAAGMTMEASHG
ncbi:AAA family ATPase [Methylobacterium sp. V23]|uniref:AAA family ATPase n=1 Tax=Methylobacterium sp. V23 TaxID=2044878 RepID=UPI000CDB9276|nr:AAA family ATPase [Methylobacterium sp. V23]POR42374.1 hypothetical protein CRT23_12950 [Methylobacterium sp. V23]